MKNKFLLFFLILSVSVFANERSAMDAAALAAQFMNQQVNAPARKASVNASSMKLSHTRLKLNSTEPAFYVFNQTNNNGYVVVSADDRTEDVLMYSDKGTLDVEKVNSNLKFWLNRLQEEISVVNDENAFTTAEKKARKAVTAISPLLVNQDGTEITWYQEAPYYNQCPKKSQSYCLTGCVATAASQIMYKWRHPATGTGSHSYTWNSKTLSIDYSTITFDWANMLPAYDGVSSTTAQKNAVATLMYCCGVACDMDYGTSSEGGSGAWTDDMGYGMTQYFGYKLTKFISTYTSKSSYETAKGTSVPLTNCEWNVNTTNFTNYFNAELEAGRPILMGGEDTDGGHEFVCDGRNTSGYFHINWGWEGDGNNYCLLSALKPSGSSYNFSSEIDAIIGLEPTKVDTVYVTGVTVAPTSLTVKQGKTSALTATVAPANATNKTVTWSSSDSKIASVSAAGVVTGVAEGSVTITATTNDGNFVATCAVTVEAVIAQKYVKVTSAPADWSGEYILVYEAKSDSACVFSGVDVANGFTPATIESNTIMGDFTTITLSVTTGGYLVKVNGGDNDGLYITTSTNANELKFAATGGAVMTLDYNTSVGITNAGGAKMRYNAASNQNRFRMYKTTSYSNQQPVQLYKLKKGGSTPVPVTAIAAAPAKDTVEIGDAIQLKCTITPDSATDQRVEFAITSGAEFATLDNGKLTGVAEGDVVVKATALDSLNKGDKLTTTYNIHINAAKLNTCAEANAAASGTNLKLNEVAVVYVNGAYVYVKDASGSTLVYLNNNGLKAGDKVAGIKGTASSYNGLPELKPTNQAADWTITAGDAPEIPAATAVPTAAEVNQVMVWKGVTDMEGEFTTSSLSNLTGLFKKEEIIFRNNFKLAQSFDDTKTYDITGAVAIYTKNSSTTIQVYFISAKEVADTTITPTDTIVINCTNSSSRLVDMIADQGIYQFYGNSDDNQYEGYVAMQNVSSIVGNVNTSNLYADYTALYQIIGTDTTEITLDAFLSGQVTLNNKIYQAEFNFKVEDKLYILNFQYAEPEFDPTKVDTIAGIAELNFGYWDDYDGYGYKSWITEAWGSKYVYSGYFLGDNTVVTDSTKLAGTYTDYDMYEQGIYDANTLDQAFEIYQSSITFTRNINGTYSITGSILCYGNQTIVLNLTTPQIGPAITHTLTLNSNDPNLGYVIGGGVYDYNTEVSVAAVCTQSGYAFTQWSDGQTIPGRKVLVTEDITLTAYFDIVKADTITIHDTTFVEVHDTTIVEVHDTTYINMIEVNSQNPTMGTAILQVYAIAESGYSFVSWTDENTDNPRTVETSENPQTFTAVFTSTQPTSVSARQEDESHVIKRIVNGRLYIECNGVIYDATGNEVER